jgi:hypothetical protein
VDGGVAAALHQNLDLRGQFDHASRDDYAICPGIRDHPDGGGGPGAQCTWCREHGEDVVDKRDRIRPWESLDSLGVAPGVGWHQGEHDRNLSGKPPRCSSVEPAVGSAVVDVVVWVLHRTCEV